jgi:hypothetical protein
MLHCFLCSRLQTWQQREPFESYRPVQNPQAQKPVTVYVQGCVNNLYDDKFIDCGALPTNMDMKGRIGVTSYSSNRQFSYSK